MFDFTKLMWCFCAEETTTRCYLMNSLRELPGFWRLNIILCLFVVRDQLNE